MMEETEKDERIPTADDVPWLLSCRVALVYVGFCGFVVVYLLRFNLSVAIVCMVKHPYRNNTHEYNLTRSANISDFVSQCGQLDDVDPLTTGEFEWSKQQRGYILSSFFYGYLFSQVPAGWLATRFGGKHVMGTGMLATIVATLLVPVATRTSVYFLVALRVIMGLGEGTTFASMQSLWGKWAPPLERTMLVGFTYAGTHIGTVLAMSTSGFLCASKIDNGWPMVFYMHGCLGILWWICWNYIAYSSPMQHPRITEKEKNYICNSVGHHAYAKDPQIPWAAIFKSPAVWAIIIAQTTFNWGNYTFLTNTPTFLKDVHKFDIKQNGVLSSLPYVFKFIGAILVAYVADLVRKKGLLTTVNTRKVFQSIASGGPAVFAVVMGFMTCQQRHLAVILLIIGIFLSSFCNAGYPVNNLDFAPRYGGLLYGITNTVSTLSGTIAPTVAGALTKYGTQGEWQKVFAIAAAIYILGLVVFVSCARGTEQDWAKGPSQEQSSKMEQIETTKC